MPDNPTHIKHLRSDRRNARKHNPRNLGMIERALGEVGAARSIVIDEDNNILAGNGTIEAAASAGIERVRVIDASGEEIIAVRRSGLTDEQKKKLALYDNRTAELAGWDIGEITVLDTEGFDLSPMFSDDELSRLIESPSADEWGAALGGLPDGEKSPFQQMTFTLHDTQAEEVKRALDVARGMGPYVDSPNENGNGNALARIVETFLTMNAGAANAER